MVVSTGQQMGALHSQIQAKGLKVINSDFTLEIEGHEHLYLLTKQCPWPELTPAGEIAIATPIGGEQWQPQQAKFNQQGAIAFYETRAGDIDNLLIALLLNEGRFNGKIYEGTPEKFLRYKIIKDCFIQMDPPDRDWENRSQPLMMTGTMFYHYYGETVAGSSYT